VPTIFIVATPIKIEESWRQALEPEFAKAYFANLIEQVRLAYKSATVFPEGSKIFAAFDSCPLPATKVVILGQDPYFNPGQAEGLSFSVRDGVPLPPSLRNIYKEIYSDLRVDSPKSGSLQRWASQGVLLLNSTLTVQAGEPNSHQKFGWQIFTDSVIQLISAQRSHVVFILWGSFAGKKAELIDANKHLVLTSAHPSPMSADRGFFGCKHFSKANQYLEDHNLAPIAW